MKTSTIPFQAAQRILDLVLNAFLMWLIICCSSLLGIMTRPVGSLAAFWPANAILIAVTVRWPKLCTLSGWSGAFAGYLAADLMTGADFFLTLWLTCANMAGAYIGVALFYTLPEQDRRLQRPQSMLHLFAISTLSGLASACVGGGATTIMFDKDWYTGIAYWLTAELVNDLLIISVILSLPTFQKFSDDFHQTLRTIRGNIYHLAPLGSLIISMFITIEIGGPGAIAFVIPSLLWCSIKYNQFETAMLTFVTLSWMLIAVSSGSVKVLSISQDVVHETMSLRIGIALMSLCPLTASSIYQARNATIAQLNHSLKHDYLTDALARRFFFEQGSQLIERASHPKGEKNCACLMIDIDHFKKINDNYGHGAGDEVLRAFAKNVQGLLTDDALFGRLGGEEFAILAMNTNFLAASSLAEMIREKVEQTPISLSNGDVLNITISLGVAFLSQQRTTDFQELLNTADRALYRAKSTGRNQVNSLVLNS